jgi:beta-phosphoglucomutase
MKFKAAVFDFNGTLFWDTGLHNQAWDMFLHRHRIRLTDEEKKRKIHGRNNELIVQDIFSHPLSADEIRRFIIEKETMYQQLVLKSNMDFAPGAIDFLRFLAEKKIPVAIATASGRENVDFYLRYLKLGSIIDEKYILYNDGKYKSKPDPDMFLAAISLLGLNSNETVIFEDSVAGIMAASRAGPGKVIVVDSYGEDCSAFGYETISHFNEVNRNIFLHDDEQG